MSAAISKKLFISKILLFYHYLEIENEKLDWLKTNLDPEYKLKEYWRETYYARKSLLKTGITVHEYSDTFPSLKTAVGADLVLHNYKILALNSTYKFIYIHLWFFQLQIDFDILYPGKDDFFFDRWATIRDFLVERLQECNAVKITEDKAFIQLLPTLVIRKSHD